MAALAITLLLFRASAASAAAPKTNCHDPQDFGQLAFCFIAQFNCLPEYFGIYGKPDYTSALACFERHKLWPFVALMYLNGEGTTRDLEKAQSVLASGRKTDPEQISPDRAEVLQNAINRCRRAPKMPCPRVDYCKDLSFATPELEICQALDQLSAEAIFSRDIVATGNKLTLADRALLDRVVAAFKAYQLDDMQRQYQASIDASLRDIAGASQAAFVRENFMRLMANAIRSRGLKPVTIRSYDAFQAKLDREVARNLSETIQFWQEGLRDPNQKDLWDRYRSHIEDYKKVARESQLQWVKFRDSCAELAVSLYRDHTGNFDPPIAMKTMVTENRIAELRNEPLAPPH